MKIANSEYHAYNFREDDISRINVIDYPVLINPEVIKNLTNKFIVTKFNEFNLSLSNDEEAGIQLDHFGEKISFYVDDIGHSNTSLISFRGHQKNGDDVHFVKHLSQIDIKLLKLDRRDKEQEKSPIGFVNWDVYQHNKYKLENSTN